MALPNPGMDAVPFTPLTAEFLDDMIENIESLSDGTGFQNGAITTNTLAESAVTANKVDRTTFPLSSSTDANGWLVKDYGIFKIATKTLSATASKVRFETATQSSSNLPVGVSTIAGLTSYFATIEAGNFSDFTALTRQNNGSSGTALAFIYMYLGPTSTTSYTVPVKFTAIF